MQKMKKKQLVNYFLVPVDDIYCERIQVHIEHYANWSQSNA